MVRLAGTTPIRLHVDLGTGTGAILHRFAGRAQQAIGIDSSRDMLAIARVNLESAGIRNAQVRHGEIYALPFPDRFSDFVTIHQVLHFLEDPPRALAEAARILEPGGRLLIVDFAPHDLDELRTEHAHRRLGIAAEQMTQWLARAGLSLVQHDVLPPPWRKEGTGLTVSMWLATAPAPARNPPAHRSTPQTMDNAP